MLYCPHCGNPNDDAARFCIGCGSPLRVDRSPPDGLSSGDRPLLFIGNFCISPLLGVVLYFLWKDKSPRKAEEVCTITWWSVGVWVALVVLGVVFAMAVGVE